MASLASRPAMAGPLLHTASKVHSDDIHAICKVSSSSFISGSKDTSVKQFTYDGRLIKVLSEYPRGYAYWITALDLFSDSSWVSGQRNGYLKCADLSGRVYVGNKLESAARETGKERNDSRICSLKCQELYKVLIGQSGRFLQYDCDTRKIVRSYKAESPDWFYGFCSIDPERVLAIHSTSLSLFQSREHDFALIDPLIRYDEELRLEQKPFISSIQPMKDDSVRQVALSFFGGEVQIFDIETKTAVFRGIEHKKRVWQAIPYTGNNFLTCADDGMIKVWDAREGASVHTLGGHPGRVSALCFLEETIFVAGTCSDDSYRDLNKGQFFFYDLRKL